MCICKSLSLFAYNTLQVMDPILFLARSLIINAKLVHNIIYAMLSFMLNVPLPKASSIVLFDFIS
jgi:hypothetical protein